MTTLDLLLLPLNAALMTERGARPVCEPARGEGQYLGLVREGQREKRTIWLNDYDFTPFVQDTAYAEQTAFRLVSLQPQKDKFGETYHLAKLLWFGRAESARLGETCLDVLTATCHDGTDFYLSNALLETGAAVGRAVWNVGKDDELHNESHFFRISFDVTLYPVHGCTFPSL